MKDEILSHWRIQESLLQSYRGIFLISQSIIFAMASVVATNPNKPIFILLLSLGLVLLYFWFQIGKARGLDVSYFQMMLLRAERNENIENILTNFKAWQKLDEGQKLRTLDEFGLARSQTRLTMETYIPGLFLMLWIFLAIITFF